MPGSWCTALSEIEFTRLRSTDNFLIFPRNHGTIGMFKEPHALPPLVTIIPGRACMNRFTLTLAVTLFLTSSPAWAETDRSSDLRYCLDMKSNVEIARCAGEISAGNKGKPLSRQEAERLLNKEQALVPADATGSSGVPATAPAADLPSPDTIHAIEPPKLPAVRTIE